MLAYSQSTARRWPRATALACAAVALGCPMTAPAQATTDRGAAAPAPAASTIGESIRAAQNAGVAERQAARAEREAAWARAAEGRVDIAVRGVRLYQSMAELEAVLRADTVSINPERQADWKPPEFAPYTETLRLADGSEVSATFASPQSGALAGAIGYVQTLRDGPPFERLVEEFVKRWGPPDETHAQGTWLTWHLKSRVATTHGLGALLRAVINLDSQRRVTRYTVYLSDHSFLRQDETRAFEARRAEQARQRDARRSDGVKF